MIKINNKKCLISKIVKNNKGLLMISNRIKQKAMMFYFSLAPIRKDREILKIHNENKTFNL